MIRTDLVAAWRLWRRQPGIPLAVVLSLSVGIGAATSVFVVSDAALWRPWPVSEPTRVVWIQSTDRGEPGDTAPGVVAAWQERARTMRTLAALRPMQSTLRDEQGADRIAGSQASAELFDTLVVEPAAGRLIAPDDQRAGAVPVVVLSHRLWRQRYGSAPHLIGRLVELDGRPRTVVGVAPAALDSLPFAGDWWTPLAIDPAAPATGPRYLDVIGRLADGATHDAARRELDAIAGAIGAVGDTGVPLSTRVTPLGEPFTGRATRVLYPMLGAMAIVLLMGSVNAATFMLAHGHRRRMELAIRAALGATRFALVRQLIVESALIVLAAGTTGVLLSQWITDGLKSVLPADLPRLSEAEVNLRGLLFLTAVSGVVAIGIGVATALRHSGTNLAGMGLATARGMVGGQQRWRATFVVVQVAMAVTLSVAGLVTIETSRSLAAVPAGYRADGVLTAAVRLPASDYATAASVRATIDGLIAAVEARSGETRAAVATRVPLSGGAPGSDLALATEPFTAGADRQVRVRFVTPAFFEVVGTPLVEGRGFNAADREGGARVVMINQTLARRLASRGSVVGESVVFAVEDFNPEPRTTWQVVGVVGDARDRGPRAEVEPEVYLTMAQGPPTVLDWIGRQVLLVARSDRGDGITPSSLRAAVGGADPRLALFDVMTLDERLGQHLATERLLSWVLVPLGAIGVALTGFGVFALAVHMVTSRRREIAVRLVMGATPGRLMAAAAGQGLRLVAAGGALGLAGALAADRALAAVAFGTRAADLRHLAVVMVLVGCTTLIAIWLPTRRALATDPGLVLRDQ